MHFKYDMLFFANKLGKKHMFFCGQKSKAKAVFSKIVNVSLRKKK